MREVPIPSFDDPSLTFVETDSTCAAFAFDKSWNVFRVLADKTLERSVGDSASIIFHSTVISKEEALKLAFPARMP
jgi:hypothetical protein